MRRTWDSKSLVFCFQCADKNLISSLNLIISSSLELRCFFIFSMFLGDTSSKILMSSESLSAPDLAIATMISSSILMISSFSCLCDSSLVWRSFCRRSNCSPSLLTRISCSFSELFLLSSSFNKDKHWDWADSADAALASAVACVIESCDRRSSNSLIYYSAYSIISTTPQKIS